MRRSIRRATVSAASRSITFSHLAVLGEEREKRPPATLLDGHEVEPAVEHAGAVLHDEPEGARAVAHP